MVTADSKALGVSTPFDWARIVMSLGLLIFSVVIVMALIADRQTKISADVHPAVAYVVLWAGIIWMSMVEGGQASMVGLPPVDPELYKESHKTTYYITSVGHKGDNLDRYLMGRQFMVIFINFCISLSGAPIAGATVLNMPQIIIKIFLESGIAMVLTNVQIGQLMSQINASHCMLDYINNHFMTFTLWVALLIEKTGVMHFSYAIQMMAYMVAGKPVATNEPNKGGAQIAFFWARVVMSLAILCFALAVTFDALFKGQTTMAQWGLPNGVSVVLFVILVCCVGLLEGMQIAFFWAAKLKPEDRGDHPMAKRVCNLLFKGEGKNLPGFMVGRQMCVTLCFFVIARVTTLDVEVGVDENIFGVQDWVQNFFNTGFLGAVITTILGSISWQLVAGAFPVAFLSNPIVYIFLCFCLFLEFCGICSAAWLLAMIQKKVLKLEYDEVYIGTPEEREAKQHADDPEAQAKMVHMGTALPNTAAGGHGLPKDYGDLIMENFSNKREQIMRNIAELREQVKDAGSPAEKSAFEEALSLEVAALKKLNSAERESMRQLEADKE